MRWRKLNPSSIAALSQSHEQACQLGDAESTRHLHVLFATGPKHSRPQTTLLTLLALLTRIQAHVARITACVARIIVSITELLLQVPTYLNYVPECRKSTGLEKPRKRILGGGVYEGSNEHS